MRRILTTALVLGVPRAALACPVCFGQTDSPLASATNMGIIVMLVIIGGVLAGFASFIFYLNRRARLFADGAELADPEVRATSSTTPQEGIAQC